MLRLIIGASAKDRAFDVLGQLHAWIEGVALHTHVAWWVKLVHLVMHVPRQHCGVRWMLLLATMKGSLHSI